MGKPGGGSNQEAAAGAGDKLTGRTSPWPLARLAACFSQYRDKLVRRRATCAYRCHAHQQFWKSCNSRGNNLGKAATLGQGGRNEQGEMKTRGWDKWSEPPMRGSRASREGQLHGSFQSQPYNSCVFRPFLDHASCPSPRDTEKGWSGDSFGPASLAASYVVLPARRGSSSLNRLRDFRPRRRSWRRCGRR